MHMVSHRLISFTISSAVPSMSSHVCCPTDRPALPGKMKDHLLGQTVKIPVHDAEPMDCYVVGTSKNWIVVVYDIFGMHPNKYEFADWVASTRGLSVAIPDVRRGKNWPMNLYPPPTPEAKADFYKYLEGDANPKNRGVETRAAVDFVIDTKGAATVSLVGLCWGAKVCSLVDKYRSVTSLVGVHPSFLKSEDGEKQSVPTLMLPAAEDNLTQYLTGALRNKNPALFAVSEQYLGTFHGFMGARGQWEKTDERPFVEKAKVEITDFVLKHSSH